MTLLRDNYDKKNYEIQLEKKLGLLRKEIIQHRKSNFIGSMLSHHQLQSTKFLSKWIEAKSLLNDKIIE